MDRGMTTQQTFKRRVRGRMAKTGESYTTARRQLLARTGGLFEELSADEPLQREAQAPASSAEIRAADRARLRPGAGQRALHQGHSARPQSRAGARWPQPLPGRLPPQPAGVFFTCDDIQKTYQELKAKGVRFAQPPVQMFFGW